MTQPGEHSLTRFIQDVQIARTLLFVPGDRYERFPKALTSGAEAIILDLEDAVAPTAKDMARDNVQRWHAEHRPGIVRINPRATAWYEDDVQAIAARPCVVMLPKASHPSQVNDLHARLPARSGIIPIIETAAGVLNAEMIGAASGVVRLAFGNGDLAAQLGVAHSSHVALGYARSKLVLASAVCGLPAPLDGVTTALRDEAALAADCSNAVELGFGGKLCIHPRQVPTVEGAFSPSRAQLDWAARVVSASVTGSVIAVDGQMIDKPILQRAQRLLDLADRGALEASPP